MGTTLLAGLAFAALGAWSLPAWAAKAKLATPRDDISSDWIDAIDQFGEMELDAAKATLESAIARAEGAGLGNDPVLARLYVLKGGIDFSLTNDESRAMESFKRAVELDWHVQLPIELQSDKLSQMLERARGSVGKRNEAIVHTPPVVTKGEEVNVSALANVPLPDESNIVLYHRPLDSGKDFTPVYLKLHGNVGEIVLPPESHGDVGLEYFIYIFDVNNQPLAGLGDQEHPMVVQASGEGGGGGKVTPGGGSDKGKKPRGTSTLPRVFINLGVGTGIGVVTRNATAELTYQQYRPGTIGGTYTPQEQACALDRWLVAGGDLAADQIEFQQHLQTIQSAGPNILPPTPQQDLVEAYNPSFCRNRHPVSAGLAPALFHIAPEIGVRVSNRIVVGLFSRLQVVTGSKVFDVDPTKDVAQSYAEDVLSPAPTGVRNKPPFSWAIGAKFKYFLGKDEKKFRLFVGAFAGYGVTRLRVDMNFSNDRNGNSVPDGDESALHGPLDLMGRVVPETCLAVWPYNNGCMGNAMGEQDNALAIQVRSNARDDKRIDTVKIGPGFVGALFGFHYQIVKYFGIYAEADLGGWFPDIGTVLLDINVGPSITF